MADGHEFDMVVIGAGSGGTRASRFAASNWDVKVAIVELPFGLESSDEIGGAGGTCVIRGCVPKKLFVYGSQYSEAFEDAAGFGWRSEIPTYDWNMLLEAKEKEVIRLNGVYNNLLKNAGVERIEGRAKVADPHTVTVQLSSGGERTLTAKYILIATGSSAVKLPIPGHELAITSDGALVVDDLSPNKTIVIVGGGYIAVEFAGIFNAMGATVHLFFRKALPLRGFDEECRGIVHANLQKRGIHVHALCSPQEVKETGDGKFVLVYKDNTADKIEQVVGDKVMFATGRKPNIHDLGLEEVGVKTNSKGAVVVDEYSQSSVPSIYAIGDVTDRMNLTPVALMEGMAVAQTLFGNHKTAPDHKMVASAVFCQPPLATVGISEEEAIATLSGEIDVYVSSFRPLRNTLSGRDEKAFMKIIAHAGSGRVVGVHMVGDESAEIMQGIAIAVKLGAKKSDFDATVGIHPTMAEEFVSMRTKTRTVPCKGTAHL